MRKGERLFKETHMQEENRVRKILIKEKSRNIGIIGMILIILLIKNSAIKLYCTVQTFYSSVG